MVLLRRLLTLILLATGPLLAHAQSGMRDLPLGRGDAVLPLYVASTPQAQATVILLPGGDAAIGRVKDGEPGSGNFLVRTREMFREAGFHVVIAFRASDMRELDYRYRAGREHMGELEKVVDFATREFGKPVWLVGTSRGTESAASVGIRLQDHPHIKGLVLTASILVSQDGTAVPEQPLKTYPGSVLVVHHTQDSCRVTRYADLPKLRAQLNPQAPHAVLTYAEGISQGDPCQALAHHGFNGIEPQVVSDMVAWMLKH